jgi:hypothetical protein
MLVPTPLLVAEEVRRTRKGQLVTPRTLRERLAARRGRLNPKWPPGPARQAERLRREGHRVSQDRVRGFWSVQ